MKNNRYNRNIRLNEKLFLSAINLIERRFHSDSMRLVDKTPFNVIYEEDLLSVRHYPSLAEQQVTVGKESIQVQSRVYPLPLVLVPPLAVGAFVFDLYPERSIVRYFLAKGFDVYLINWGNPDKDHSHLSFEHYLLNWMPNAIQEIREHAKVTELSLFGYCMGGLFSLIYTAIQNDQNIRNIITVGSPIDMHQLGAAGKFLSLTYRRVEGCGGTSTPQKPHTPKLIKNVEKAAVPHVPSNVLLRTVSASTSSSSVRSP